MQTYAITALQRRTLSSWLETMVNTRGSLAREDATFASSLVNLLDQLPALPQGDDPQTDTAEAQDARAKDKAGEQAAAAVDAKAIRPDDEVS